MLVLRHAIQIATFLGWTLSLATVGFGQFASSNIDLLAQVPNRTGDTSLDLWGWTDSQTGIEYALIGHTSGVDFYDLTDPSNPDYRGRWAGVFGFDVKVYGDYAYVVNGGSSGTTGVLDLAKVRNAATPQNFFSDNSFSPSYHNVFVNEETGFLYGASPNLDIWDLRSDPVNPTFIRTIGGGGHDSMSAIYQGPDTRYQGKEILFGSQESRFRIHDVDDKANVATLSINNYPQRSYVHQGWLSQDHHYFFLADEGDTNSPGSRTHVFDVADLEQPLYLGFYAGPTRATDHNLYVKGELLYLANYTAGTRVIRLDDPATLDMTEIAFLDTYPPDNSGNFAGNFTTYPYFESGVLIGSDFTSGLFVMRLDLGNDADFNDDGAYDCADIDALVATVAGGMHAIEYDLTDDGLVKYDDVTNWLSEAGEAVLGPGKSFLPGDATLDGVVDTSDFNRWNENKFTSTAAWCQGDFTANGVIDVEDFNEWNANKFQTSLDAVPEPASAWLLALSLTGLLWYRRGTGG